MDPVAAEVGVRLAGSIEQDERARRGRDRGLDHVAREQDPLAAVIERQAVLEEPPSHLGPADLHADLGQHAHAPRRRSGS